MFGWFYNSDMGNDGFGKWLIMCVVDYLVGCLVWLAGNIIRKLWNWLFASRIGNN